MPERWKFLGVDYYRKQIKNLSCKFTGLRVKLNDKVLKEGMNVGNLYLCLIFHSRFNALLLWCLCCKLIFNVFFMEKTMRNYCIAGNWKMNKTKTEAVALAKELVTELKNKEGLFIITPSFTNLDSVSQVISGSNIRLAAQNVAVAESGAYTGEVSAEMLKSVGVQFVIVGHSERRDLYGETDEIVNTKIKVSLKNELKVIFCIGEQLETREKGEAESFCAEQIEKGLQGISAEDVENVIIAYEPVWAIGTGKTATPEDAEAMHETLRSKLAKLYSPEIAKKVSILYGGSMNVSNAQDLLKQPNIDGGLIGGASLKAETFVQICNFV